MHILPHIDLFGHFDGSVVPLPKFAIVDEEENTSKLTDAYKAIEFAKALLSLLIASLSHEAIEYVIGSKTAREAWLISVIAMLRFLVLCKPHRKLHAARVKISDDDFTIAALNGLPSKCDMIRTVLIARESSLSLKDFHPHLLVIETTAEAPSDSRHFSHVSYGRGKFNGGRNDNSQFRPFSEFLGGSITSFKSNLQQVRPYDSQLLSSTLHI
ncbi:unnamed protein product [Prunus armeniaca]